MANRPTLAQIETLVQFLEQNVGIAKGLLRTNQAKMEIKRKWASVATTLNSLGGVNKDGQGWAKYWAEKKCALKKLCAQHSKSMRRTGGGSADDLPMLSALDKRLVAVMGGQEFAFGDCQLAVDSFHHSEHQIIQANPLASPAEKINLQSENEEAVIGIRISPIPGTSQDTPQSPPHKKQNLKRKYIPEPEVDDDKTQCQDDDDEIFKNSQTEKFKDSGTSTKMVEEKKDTAPTLIDVHGCNYFGQLISNELLRFDANRRYIVMQQILQVLHKSDEKEEN